MRMSFPIVPALVGAIGFGSGCSSAEKAAEKTWASGPPAAKEYRDVFAPLDLPTPSTIRTAAGLPGTGYWQQQVDYKIAATLDAENQSISAKATVTYHNNSPDALPILWLHLEQNLFKPDSVGTLSTPPDTRFSAKQGFEGGYKIESVSAGGAELPFAVHDVLGRIDLPEAIAAGGTYTFDIAWSFDVPEYGIDRFGIEKVEQGTIFQLAQWFPCLCKYDDVSGWNTLPYLGQGEFYTDYGTYDVSITVPRSHIVVATGQLRNAGDVLTGAQRERMATARKSKETTMIITPEEVGTPESRPAGEGPLTWTFHAEKVRTFAWTSSDAYIWDACGFDGGGDDETTDSSKGTLVQSVYPKEGAKNWAKSSDMLRFSIEHYSDKWFRYPYPVATNVNGRVGGMEYPMIIYCADRWSEEGLYGVTTHEIGHNWFPMLVNSDERRYGWMDEGFNTFINIYSGAARFHNGEYSNDMSGTAQTLNTDNVPPLITPADQIPGWWYGNRAYGHPADGLYLLREHILGSERFDAAFRAYVAAWAFKSPQPADFFRCMNTVSGEDLSWFWREWFYESEGLDLAVDRVVNTQNRSKVYVSFSCRDNMVMPVVFRVTYDDGSTEMRSLPVAIWHGAKRWTTSWDPGKRWVTRVELDPEFLYPDHDRDNNAYEVGDSSPVQGERRARRRR